MVSVEGDKPEKFSLMMEDSMAMLRLHCINEEISKMSENMIGHGRGLHN